MIINKKISIIIPCHNVEQYLEKCIASVYDQQIHEEDFELILIDDESPDDSLELARNLTLNKNNVKIISQKNKGLGGARNTGILNSNGDYILFLDADDRLLPCVLSEIINIAQNNDLDILEFGARGINAENKIIYEVTNTSDVLLSGFAYYNTVRYMHSACNKLYKRTFLTDNNIFFLEKIYIEDFEFNTRCLLNVKKIQATPVIVSQFLQSVNSITRTTDKSKRQKMISDIIQVIKRTDQFYHAKPNDAQQRFFYLERLNFLVATLFYQLVKDRAPYEDLVDLKAKLVKDDIFYVNHIIFDKRKNLFRNLLIRNLWVYKFINIFLRSQ